MVLAALPRDASGICRVVGLDVQREGGILRVGLLLCDGAVPAQDAPARLFLDATTEETLTVRLPDLEDAPYEHMELEVIGWQQ